MNCWFKNLFKNPLGYTLKLNNQLIFELKSSMNSYPSKIFEEAVNEFSKLPGIGHRSALRMVLHLLKQSPEQVEKFGNTFLKLKREIKYCRNCHNISDTDLCSICSNPKRDTALICIVEDVRDLIAVENTGQYFGLYHVLGGIISPMDGIGPSDLTVESLLEKLKQDSIKEVITALSTTMEGDTTVFYLYKKISQLNRDIKFSTIARGVSIGDDLEYADEVTLGRSILNRTPYENTLVR
jgi:recombination protein RecR